MTSFIVGLVIGIVLGIVTGFLIFNNNKKFISGQIDDLKKQLDSKK